MPTTRSDIWPSYGKRKQCCSEMEKFLWFAFIGGFRYCYVTLKSQGQWVGVITVLLTRIVWITTICRCYLSLLTCYYLWLTEATLASNNMFLSWKTKISPVQLGHIQDSSFFNHACIRSTHTKPPGNESTYLLQRSAHETTVADPLSKRSLATSTTSIRHHRCQHHALRCLCLETAALQLFIYF